MKLNILFEAFDQWSYHKHIVANPNAEDLISLIKLMDKNKPLGVNNIYSLIADMIPEWRSSVFPKLSKEDLEKVIQALRGVNLDPKQLIDQGLHKGIENNINKKTMIRKFTHEKYLADVMNDIMHEISPWNNLHPNIMLDVIEENPDLLEKLDPEFVQQYEQFVDKKIDEFRRQPSMVDLIKKSLNDNG